MASFKSLATDDGLNELNTHLSTRSYITGFQASTDDLAVYSAVKGPPDGKRYVHVGRWYKHIKALLGNRWLHHIVPPELPSSFPGKAEGVSIAGGAEENGAPEELEKDVMAEDDDDDDDDLDLFGETTEEEKAAAEAKKKAVAEKIAKSKANALKAKSMIIIDVKPWDDTTGHITAPSTNERFLLDMKALEDEVRGVVKDGLLWGQSKLVPVGFGIRKLQITAVIEDVKIESFDEIIEDYLVKDGDSENIQSVDIVAFNKI